MSNKVLVKRSAVQGQTPTTAQLDLGELAINTYDGKLFIKKSVAGVQSIVEIGNGGTGSGVTVSETAPTSPTAGDLWWNSATGDLLVYYNDGSGSQWVIANGPSAGPAGPGVPVGGTTGQVLAKASGTDYDTEWVDAGTGGGPGSYVVGDPVFSTQSLAQNGQLVTVTAEAESLLNGVAITSITFTTPAGTVTSTATAGVASTTFTATGSVGATITLSAFATDALGNISRTVNYTVTISSSFVNKATISSPLDGATLVENGLTITTAAFAATGTTDTLASTEFQAWSGPLGTGTLVWSDSSSASLSIVVPDNSIAAGATVYLRARHLGTTLGSGQWSDDVQITTAPVLTPSAYGAAYQGGFYAGRITLAGSLYALVVAPASTETSLAAYSTTAGTLSTQAKSLIDGLANTNELLANDPTNWLAAKYCGDLTTAGYTDWYLPALLELELLYRLFKPTDALNTTTQISTTLPTISAGATGGLWNYQTYSTPAGGTAYTNSASVATNPALTTVTAFQVPGVQEAFSSGITYWSSSGPSGSTTNRENMAFFSFGTGSASADGSTTGSASTTTTARNVRAVRRVFLRTV